MTICVELTGTNQVRGSVGDRKDMSILIKLTNNVMFFAFTFFRHTFQQLYNKLFLFALDLIREEHEVWFGSTYSYYIHLIGKKTFLVKH